MSNTFVDAYMSDIDTLRFMVNMLYDGDRDGMALRLLERFGNISGVFEATREELAEVRGMTDRAASFFTSVFPIARQALLRELHDTRLNCETAVAGYAFAYFIKDRSMADICICLDKNNERIVTERLTSGAPAREIISCACRSGAEKLLWLRHRMHGNGAHAAFGSERAEAVGRLAVPLSALGIELLDYIEYSPFVFNSLRRAVIGKTNPITVDKASSDEYSPIPKFQTLLNEYISKTARR